MVLITRDRADSYPAHNNTPCDNIFEIEFSHRGVISSVLFGTAEDAYGSNMHLDSAVGTHLWKYARMQAANNLFCSVKPG